MKTKDELIDELLDLAFAEDIGDGDHTTLCCIPADEMGKQHLLVKRKAFLQEWRLPRRCFINLIQS